MQRNREGAYDRYRRILEVQNQCLKKKTAYFIENHESTVTINVNRTEEDLPAVLIFSDQEGPDEALLYVSINDDFIVHDYFTWKNTTFFAYEQVQIAKDVDYIKFKVLMCNVFVNESFWAYFKSTLRSAKDTTMSAQAERSTLVPLLIAPKNEELRIGGVINFNNQTWDIEDGDIFTLSGIGYYYLSRGLNSRDEDEYEPVEEDSYYYIGSVINLSTEGGFYNPNLKVKLKERTLNSISLIPLEAGELKVITLKDGNSVENTFVIKENV